MRKTYTLEDLAGLAGVARSRVRAWEAQGLLGEVPRNGHDEPSYGFEQAERCEPDRGPHQVDEAGDEKADAHRNRTR